MTWSWTVRNGAIERVRLFQEREPSKAASLRVAIATACDRRRAENGHGSV
jgi:hypothetical protein